MSKQENQNTVKGLQDLKGKISDPKIKEAIDKKQAYVNKPIVK